MKDTPSEAAKQASASMSLALAERRLRQLEAQGHDVLAIQDESYWRKPRASHWKGCEAWTVTVSTKTPRLFTLRMWQEETDKSKVEWRGKVQALPEGEAYYFRDWPGLIRHLETMLEAGHGSHEHRKETDIMTAG